MYVLQSSQHMYITCEYIGMSYNSTFYNNVSMYMSRVSTFIDTYLLSGLKKKALLSSLRTVLLGTG